MRPHRMPWAILIGVSLLALAGTAAAPDERSSQGDRRETGKDPIVVNVWAAADTPSEERLSRDFAAAGLTATASFREWQRRIAFNIQLHLPLCEPCLAVDGDRAAEDLRLAALAAATDADRAALQQLLNLADNLRRWSDALVKDNRNWDLGRYYMSPTALTDDPLFKKSEQCAKFLGPMLASGRLAEDRSCQ
jgi:hypothetical protein